jgi:putative oxidoreductase
VGLLRVNDLILLVARIALGSLFVPSGIGKLSHFAQFAQSLGQKVPYSEGLAVLAIAAEIGGGMAIVLGLWPRYTAALMVVFTLVATGLSHRYWTYEGAAQRSQEINFYKNVAIIGGLLCYAVSGAGRLRIQVGKSN